MAAKHIAVLDDDPDFTEMLAMRLAHEGYWVKGYVSGLDLLSELAQTPPELIILDLNMPEMSGHQVAFHLQENHPDIKIIISTAILDENVRMRTEFWSQAVAYLQKPFAMDELIAIIRQHVPLP
jgi:DNA-binding response OmpR family regulator